MIGKLAFVFVMAVICESFYTGYAYYVSRADLVRAPAAAGAIAIFKAVLVIQYVREPIMIAALAIGQVIGTYMTLRFIKRND